MARKFDRGYSFRSSDFSGDARRDHRHGGLAAPVPSGLTEGQKPCARGEWCAASVTVTEGRETWREGAPGYQAFCPRDELSIGRWLGEMPAQYVYLAAELGKPSARGRMVRIPFGPRVPLRADVDALMHAIAESLVSWHERVAVAADLSFPEGRRRDGRAVAMAAEVLEPHLGVLLALQPEPMRRAIDLRDVAALPEDTEGVVHSAFAEHDTDMGGADAGLEIITLRHLSRALLGETRNRPEELVGVPCRADECGWRAVYRAELPSPEDEPVWWTECARCGDRMTEEEYREWVALCAAYERHRVREPAVLENLPGVA
ncbi:MAG TPA: hypothetical protein VFW33_00435 [Gemmataceae bacterium]|nr:hypothetical protein [Gemmataceae bacterium]